MTPPPLPNIPWYARPTISLRYASITLILTTGGAVYLTHLIAPITRPTAPQVETPIIAPTTPPAAQPKPYDFSPLYTRAATLKPIHDIMTGPTPRTIQHYDGSDYLTLTHIGCTPFGATLIITGTTGRDTDRAALATLIIRETLDGITYNNDPPQCAPEILIVFLDSPSQTATATQLLQSGTLPPAQTTAYYAEQSTTIHNT